MTEALTVTTTVPAPASAVRPPNRHGGSATMGAEGRLGATR